MNIFRTKQPAFRKAKLIVEAYDGSSRREFGLARETSIGRMAESHIQLYSHQVSRRHAQIFSNHNGWLLRDLGSMNGTYLNGNPVEGERALNSGDEITFGDVPCVFVESASPLELLLGDETREQDSSVRTQLIPVVQSQFLPENDICDEKILRQDYEKLRVLYELQKEIGSEINIDTLLNKILGRTFEFLECDQVVVLLTDERGELKPQAFKAKNPGNEQVISSSLVNCVRDKKAGIIWDDVMSDGRFNQSDSLIIRGVRSSMAVPILDSDKLLGAIIIEAFQKIGAFSEKDLHLMTTIANHACQFIKNSMLHRELKISFDSAVTTLSAVVDARHPLTAGHSERVAYYARLIGEELHLDTVRMETLRLAALLHDIGKIGIRDEILFKKGTFTENERREMNAHTTMTRKILDNFHFPQKLQNIPEVAGLHHERFDGKGYPEGLSGKQLPLETRILTLADIFDALTSRRDYPKYDGYKADFPDGRLPLADAIDTIEKERGEYFDPVVVEAFKRCLPRALIHYRGKHFEPDYVDSMIKSLAPGLLYGADN